MNLIPPALVGPRCTDPDGFPRYAATIWLDFLHAHQAVATREKHALSIGSLYRDAEAMNPSVDLDNALMTANIFDLERVLSSALIGHQAHGSDDKRRAVQKRFVFGFLATVIGAESPDLIRELRPQCPSLGRILTSQIDPFRTFTVSDQSRGASNMFS